MTQSPQHFYPPDYRAIDPRIRQEHVRFHAEDGMPLLGTFYLPPDSDPGVALLVMHPRGDFTRHYLAPHLALGGYAVFGCTTRHLHNDADALHERLLVDVAGAMRLLRARGYRTIVMVGNSGGGSLFSFYLAQAGKAPAERLTHAPSGDPVPLADYEMPMPDGFVLVAAHPGEGRFLLERLDPSVVDEADPSQVEPRLDMYDPRNGYVPMHLGPSRYSADFLAGFRAAQEARCERIDRRCLEWCEESRYFRARMKTADSSDERRLALRRGLPRRYLIIYRTLADPRYLDPTLDPSNRPLGSVFSHGGRDPVAANYGEGLARTMSARGWLSTWSGLRSNARLDRTLPEVSLPLLIVYPDADSEIYPSEQAAFLEAAASKDKALVTVPFVDHYFFAYGKGLELGDGRERMVRDTVLPWLRERYPA